MAFEDNWTEFRGEIDGSSAKAVRFKAEEWDEFEWIPRSQMEIQSEDEEAFPKQYVIWIKGWLVEKNGWVGGS